MPILGSSTRSPSSSLGEVAYPSFAGRGVNYLSLYNTYSSKYTSDEILRRDFSRFKQNGINVICLNLYWYRLEGNVRGYYDGVLPDGSPYGDRFLDNVKRVINVSRDYDIKVLVTIQTLWGENDSTWCTPKYVVDPTTGNNTGLAIVRSDSMRQAFVDMFNHTVQYLAGTPGIWAWALLNEPWYWPHTLPSPYDNVDQKENFIDLIQKLSEIVKTFDGRPVTIRFCNTHTWVDGNGVSRIKNIFVDDWNWDQRIFDALDFVSFNSYGPEQIELQSVWQNITKENVLESRQRNKKVWITEFGFNSDDDSVQTGYFRETVEFLKSLPIEGCIAWFWRSDRAPSGWAENPGEIGKGFNLCASAEGTPRAAYLQITG